MGSCKSQELNLVFIGQEKSGKTAMSYRLSRNTFVETTPTIGVLKNEARLGKLSLIIVDVAQLPRFQEYLSDSDIVVFVYDASDSESADDQLLMLESSLDVMSSDPTRPILILVNKMDIITTSVVEQEKRIQEKLQNVKHFQLLRTSAKTGEGIDQIPQVLSNLVSHRKLQ